MSLTDQEKKAGTEFLLAATAYLDSLKVAENQRGEPVMVIPAEVVTFRHACHHHDGTPWRGLRTRSLVLAQQYIFSPAYPEYGVEASRFGYVFNLGQCKTCGLIAIGDEGWLADALDRPPLPGSKVVQLERAAS